MSVQVQQARKGSMSWIVGVILAIFLLAGCSSTTTVGSDTEPCSPGFQPANEYGSISAQQAGPGDGIQWGVYPNTPADTYSVDIYINGKRVDHKDQDYQPHGSVNAVDVPSGAIFQLTGTATLGSDIAYFYLTCRGA